MPGIQYPEYPAGSVVELRVHGVGGEPPSQMTRDPHPVQVAGDDVIGVFRARDPVVSTLGDAPDAALHVREVVSWGAQTSGTWRHALWVLLLPFAMFNVSGRMHLAGWRGAGHRAVGRALALSMTLTMIGLACTLGMDLVATQYVAQWDAVDPPFWVVPFRAYLDDPAGSLALAAGLPSVALIVLWVASRYQRREAAVPVDESSPPVNERLRLTDPDFWSTLWATSRMRGLHVTAGTAWIAGALALAVMEQTGVTTVGMTLVALEAVVVGLAVVLAMMPVLLREAPVLWLDWQLVAIRVIALGPLGWLMGSWLPTAVVTDWVVGTTRAGGDLTWLVAVAAVALVGGWLVMMAPSTSASPPTSPSDEASQVEPDSRVWPNILLLAGGFMAGLPPSMAAPAPAGGGDIWADLPARVDQALAVLLGSGAGPIGPYVPLAVLGLVQLVLILALAAMSIQRGPLPTRSEASPIDDGRTLPWHTGAVVLAMLSLFIIVAVGAGLHGLVADMLGDRVIDRSVVDGVRVGAAGTPVPVPIVVVPWLVWSAKVMIGVIVGAVGWGLVSWHRRPLPPAEQVSAQLAAGGEAFGAGVGPGELDRGDLDDVGRLWTLQWLVRHGGSILLAGVLAGVAMLGVILAALNSGTAALGAQFLDGLSMTLAVLLPGAGFFIVRSSLSERATRRQIGRLWDVLTFWPRVTHPFAPPCYAETLVPGIADRVQRIVHGQWPHNAPPRSPSSVVLAGHSQGSMVSLAAAAQLDDDVAASVALVSYGSPIAILYERMFREPFAAGSSNASRRGGSADGPFETSLPAVFARVEATVHSWHHITAMTEPFAMPFWNGPTGTAVGNGALGGTDADGREDGWPVTLQVPFAVPENCPVCRSAPSAVSPVTRGDFLIRDPLGWDLAQAGGRLLPAGGHGAYRNNPDLDAHMAQIARVMFASTPASLGRTTSP